MSWYEINVKTTEMSIDAVSNMFVRRGANGVQILNPNDPDLQGNASGQWDFFEPENNTLDFEGVLITAYLDVEPEAIEGLCADIQAEVASFKAFGLDPGLAATTYKSIHPEDWENEWKKYFKPFRLGKHMVVKPTWETFEVKEDDVVIEIDPGNAFGSGTHETTSLCIELLEKYIEKGQSVIDVGCGSGILGIAAGLLGAGSVFGVDIDHVAVKTARANVEQNNLTDITSIEQGNLIDVIKEPADIVVANIIAEIIVMLCEDVHRVMKPEGVFIASGIITTKLEWVTENLLNAGYTILETVTKGDWAVIVSKYKR